MYELTRLYRILLGDHLCRETTSKTSQWGECITKVHHYYANRTGTLSKKELFVPFKMACYQPSMNGSIVLVYLFSSVIAWTTYYQYNVNHKEFTSFGPVQETWEPWGYDATKSLLQPNGSPRFQIWVLAGSRHSSTKPHDYQLPR
jgi:hypothetical protein